MTRYLLIILTLLFATGARAEICRGMLHNPGIEAGRMARIGNCNIAKHGDTEAVFDACRYWQPYEVEARPRAGEIVEVLSVPTADQVCRGRLSVDNHGVAKIRATSDIQPDPLACRSTRTATSGDASYTAVVSGRSQRNIVGSMANLRKTGADFDNWFRSARCSISKPGCGLRNSF